MYHSRPLWPRSSSKLRTANRLLFHFEGENEMLLIIRNRIASGRGFAGTLALILALGLGLSVTAAGAASDRYEAQSPSPTIVFVHGGWADSSRWNQQITNLQRPGYPLIHPTNPLRALASDAAHI